MMESKALAESGDSKTTMANALAESRREAGLDDEEGDLARAIELSKSTISYSMRSNGLIVMCHRPFNGVGTLKTQCIITII